jgi:general secretion pathway protein N
MRFALLVAAAVCLLATAVAMEAPATLVDREVNTLTGGRLRVADATGTLWNGAGTLILLPYAARVPVRWHIDALPLLRAHLSGTLGRDTAEAPQSAFDLGSDDFAIHRFTLAVPAEALFRAGGVPSVIAAAGGSVDIRADDFAMRHGLFTGGFIVRWQGASIPGLRPDLRFALGDVRLEAAGSGAELRSALSNAGGDVEITGALTLSATGAARVDARLKPRSGIDADRSKSITTALSMIAAPDDSGGFRFLWQASGR